MFSNTKRARILLASLLVTSCIGAYAADKEFSTLPDGSFPLAITKTGSGIVPGDRNIYVQLVSTPNTNGKGELWYMTIQPDTIITNGPNPKGTGSLVALQKGKPGERIPSFKLSDLVNGTMILPGDGNYAGARLYMSIGKPLEMSVNPTADGYIQPDLNNPADKNIAIPYDFVEFAYDTRANHIGIPFGVNLTQVDGFAFPFAFKLHGIDDHSKVTVVNRGITLNTQNADGTITLGSSGVDSRDALINKYLREVSKPFSKLTRKVDGHIMSLVSPYHGKNFQSGGANASYFEPYVDSVWQSFLNPRTLSDQSNFDAGNKYTVTFDGSNKLNVTRTDVADKSTLEFTTGKPSTEDILRCSGDLSNGDGGTAVGRAKNAFGAMLCGALNRHVAENEKWSGSSTFYKQSPNNEWSKFWHSVSIDGLAYGFGYDDTGENSSVAVLPKEDHVSYVELNIGW